MKKRTLPHLSGKGRFVCPVFFFLLLAALILPPCRAEQSVGGSSSDVHVTIPENYSEDYRYSFDVIFYDMLFTYRLDSISYNSETGETFVNSGVWLMEENPVTTVEIEVTNHSDTPIAAEVKTDLSDFIECGASVSEEGLNNTVLKAVSLDQDEYRAESGSRKISLGIYPDYASYKGAKQIYATVYVRPVDGLATNGRPFITSIGKD